MSDERDWCSCGEYLRPYPTGMLPSVEAEAAPAPANAGATSTASNADLAALTLRAPGGDPGEPLGPVPVTVRPGERAVVLAVLRNQGDVVDNYELKVAGLPAGWWTIERPMLRLLPQGPHGDYEGETRILVHPPRERSAQAKVWDIEVVARSLARDAVVASASVTVEVGGYQDVRTELVPQRARGRRRAQFTLAVENRGNAPADVDLGVRDADDECRFHIAQSRVRVESGERVEVPIVVRPPRPMWIGRVRERPLEATASTAGGDEVLASESGVFRQRPWLPVAAAAAIPIVAAAAVAIPKLLPKHAVVPVVPNLTRASSRFEAERALARAGLNPVPQVEVTTTGGRAGAIVDQIPAAGAKAKPGATVAIKVVAGSTAVTVPDVVKMTVQQAAQALSKVGLTLGEMLPPPPDPAATIDAQIPEKGAQARKGDAVVLVIVHGAPATGTTTGGATVPVPNLRGKTVQGATAALAAAGLVPKVVQRFDSSPAGSLAGTTPAAGGTAPRGATVAVASSAGPFGLIFDTPDGLQQINGADGQPAPVPGTKAGDDEATWSADGSGVAFRSGDDIKLLAGGQPQPLLHRDGYSFHDPTFAPAGRTLAVIRRGPSGDGDLCLVAIKKRVSPPSCIKDPGTDLGRSVSWSPDGREILVAAHPKGHPDTFGLVLYRSKKPFATQAAAWGKRRVVTDASKPGVGVLAGAFSPDGKRLAAAANVQGGFQLYITTADDFALAHAQTVPVLACGVAWRPDGAEIAVVQTDGCQDGASGQIVRIDPANPKSLQPVAPKAAHPAWKPLPPGP